MNSVKIVGVILAMALSYSVLPVSSHAQTSNVSARDRAEKVVQVVATRRCALVQAKLQVFLDASDSIKQEYLDRYQVEIDALNNIVTRLEFNDQAVDTTVLASDSSALNSKVAEFETDFGTYQAALRAAINVHCAQTGDLTELREAVGAVRASRAELAADAQDIQAYLHTDIKSHLADIQSQLEATVPTTDTPAEQGSES